MSLTQSQINITNLYNTAFGIDPPLEYHQIPKAFTQLVVAFSQSTAATGTEGTTNNTGVESRLDTINAKLPNPVLGEGGSVVISNQLSGVATQTTLEAILTRTPGLGQALAIGSTPVVLTSAQQAILDSLNGKLPLTLGAKTAASSFSITPATDSVYTVNGSSFTQPISASALPLPSGAATQTTLAAIETKLPSNPLLAGGTVSISNQITGFAASTQFPSTLGTKTAANSLSVTPATDAIYASSLSVVLTPVGASTPYTIATANVFQSVFAANANRRAFKVQNIGSIKMEVAAGASGSEILLQVLNPGEDFSLVIGEGITRDRISVRSTSVGGGFIAWEA